MGVRATGRFLTAQSHEGFVGSGEGHAERTTLEQPCLKVNL